MQAWFCFTNNWHCLSKKVSIELDYFYLSFDDRFVVTGQWIIHVQSDHTHMIFWVNPHIRWQYGMRNKAAMSLIYIRNKEQGSCLVLYSVSRRAYIIRFIIERTCQHELKLHCIGLLFGCPSVVVNGARNCSVRVHCTRCSFNYKPDYSLIWGHCGIIADFVTSICKRPLL